MKLRGWKELTAEMKMSRLTILRLSREKNLPFPLVKIAGQYMTTTQKIDEWIEDRIQAGLPTT